MGARRNEKVGAAAWELPGDDELLAYIIGPMRFCDVARHFGLDWSRGSCPPRPRPRGASSQTHR